MLEKVTPAVVSVYTTQIIKGGDQQQMSPFFNDPFFQQFFGQGGGRRMKPRDAEGSMGLVRASSFPRTATF